MDDFVQLYKVFVGIEFLKEYPEVDIASNKGFDDIFHKAMVMASLKEMVKRFPMPNVRIMMKPSKGVYANGDYDADQYIVVPATCKVVIERRVSEDCPTTSVLAKFSTIGAPRAFLNPEAPSEKLVSQFWCINVKPEKEKCNCVFDEKVVKFRMPEVVGEVGEASKKKPPLT